jgi:predicted Zn-dependent peptidase
MVEDAPDDLVHEVFAQQFWSRHPLGRPILGTPDTVASFDAPRLRQYFGSTYRAPNVVIAAAGHLEHDAVRALVDRVFAGLPAGWPAADEAPPAVTPGLVIRQKDIEQSHLCLGAPAYPQAHADRHAMYVLNTVLGGSMSSRLFQHIREERGLAYAVFSNLATYSDAGAITVYAGCATEKVREVVDLTLAELRGLRDEPVPPDELQRAKDHLKGSLTLSLEHTSSRMSQLARQEMQFGRQFTLDEILAAIDAVSADDLQRVARDIFRDGAPVATVVGPGDQPSLTAEQLRG